MALIILIVVVVLLGAGGAYLATISSGRYPKLVWACALVSPAELTTLVPHGLPKGDAVASGATETSCTWDNLLALNTGLEKQDAVLHVRVRRYGRGLLTSGEDAARKWLHFDTDGGGINGKGVPASGYGDEAFRVPRAYGGQFDKLEFRESNLVVEVATEIDDHPGYQPALAWSRTQRAAQLVLQHLRPLRR